MKLVYSLITLSLLQACGGRSTEGVVLIGDSTVATISNSPTQGWGAHFGKHLDGISVTNMAVSGRSSKSFIDEGRWKDVLDMSPKYILIQFGHNDSKTDAARFTNPKTTYKDNLRKFVREARKQGAKVIFVTSIERQSKDPNDACRSARGLKPYATAMKEVAEDMNVDLLDLWSASIDWYESDCYAEASGVFFDNTHTTDEGAEIVADIVADLLGKSSSNLKKYLN